MIGMSFARGCPLFALLIVSLAAKAQPEQPKASSFESTAQLIGGLSALMELRSVSSSTVQADGWQILWLHQHIFEKVTATSLQGDATIAQIDNEISRANEVHSYLSDGATAL